MARYSRKAAILAKTETTYGTDSTPTGAANAILVSNVNATPINATNVSRDLIRTYFGASEELVGTKVVELSFDVEVAGSGALGTAPKWGALIKACGFAEAVTASTRVDYTPITDSIGSATIYFYDDGALHKLLGARGTFDMNAEVGNRPVFSFSFTGLYGGVTASANPTQTLTGFQTPEVVTDSNSDDLKIGGTYSAGAISGGTAYTSRGLTFSAGNQVNLVPLVGDEAVDITQREATGHIDVDLTAAQEVTFMSNVISNTTQSIGLVHGTSAGNKVLFFLAAAQMINPTKVDVDGRRLIGFDLRATPTSSGNDEMRIVSI